MSLLPALVAIGRQALDWGSGMLGFSVGPIVWLVVALVTMGGVWKLFDAYGDNRERKVHAEYAEAARRVNVEIGKSNNASDVMKAVADAERDKAVAAAAKVPGTCPATPEQAQALTRIR